MATSDALLLLGILVIAGHALQLLFKKTLIPDVLWIMIAGLVMGPLGLEYLSPEDFGKLGPLFSSVALVVLLFDGGSHLNLKDLKAVAGSLMGMTFLTLASSLGVIYSIVYVHTQDIGTSLVAAATLSATSAVVVVPFVRGLPIHNRTQSLLLAEAVIADILCIVLSFAVFDTIRSSTFDGHVIIKNLLSSILGAGILGIIGALLWSVLMVKFATLISALSLTLGTLFIIFGICENFHWSGPFAALCFGFVLNNRSKIPFLYEKLQVSGLDEMNQQAFQRLSDAILQEVIFMLKLFFFLFLGIQLKLNNPQILAYSLMIVLGVYSLRLLVTRFVLSRKFYQFDAGVIALMVPKGLVSAVLATQALEYIPEHGAWIEELVFAVIFWTILMSSINVPLLQTEKGRFVVAKIFSTFQIQEPAAEKFAQGEDSNV